MFLRYHRRMKLAFAFILLVCIFYWQRPLILSDTNNQGLLISVILDVCVCSYPLLIFLVWNNLFLVFTWVYLASLSWSFLSITICRNTFLKRYSWNLAYFSHLLWLKVLKVLLGIGICPAVFYKRRYPTSSGPSTF